MTFSSETERLVAVIFLSVMAALFFILGLLQFLHVGKPLNNLFIYASKKERETMDVNPVYFQSGVCFWLLALAFVFSLLDALYPDSVFLILFFIFIGIAIVYAIASTAILQKNMNNRR